VEVLELTGGDSDLVLVNGKITCGAGRPQCETVAVRNGRVQAVGSAAEVQPLVGSATTVVDLGGRRVVPGLIDSHIHVVRAGATWTERLDWAGLTSVSDALATVRDAAARLRASEWITVVGGWHPGRFDERRSPTPDELTEAAPDHPVYVQLLYEEATLNAAALRASGVVAGSPDPPGTSFERDHVGAPTGWARGRGAFAHCLGLIGEPPFEDQVAGTEAFMRRLSALGLTGVIDPGGGSVGPGSYRALFELWRRTPLPVRTRLYVSNSSTASGQELAQTQAYVRHLHPGFGDEYLRFVGLGEKLVNGYGDGEGLDPIEFSERSRTALRDVTLHLLEHGWPAHMHAIRDTTIGAVLDVWEEVDATIPLAGRRFSLAHADAVSERDLQRIKRLGIGIAVQDRLVFRAADSAKAWGEEVMRGAPPLRRMLDLGIPVGAGTDATAVTSYNPWLSIWWLVTGRSVDGAPPRRAEHRLDRLEALNLYTAGSAWFSFDEDRRGTLEPGKLADLAVLSDDYLAVDDDQIPHLTSVLTLVGGEPVHHAGEFATALPVVEPAAVPGVTPV
jgi:predicted amidohydrolase YtcJ